MVGTLEDMGTLKDRVTDCSDPGGIAMLGDYGGHGDAGVHGDTKGYSDSGGCSDAGAHGHTGGHGGTGGHDDTGNTMMPGDMVVTAGDMVTFFPLSALQWGREGCSRSQVKLPVKQEAK